MPQSKRKNASLWFFIQKAANLMNMFETTEKNGFFIDLQSIRILYFSYLIISQLWFYPKLERKNWVFQYLIFV